jgi:hypothetical protein
MKNMEAYQSDLDDILENLKVLSAYVPLGNAKQAREARERFEKAAGDIRTTVGCMKNDYIPIEQSS